MSKVVIHGRTKGAPYTWANPPWDEEEAKKWLPILTRDNPKIEYWIEAAPKDPAP